MGRELEGGKNMETLKRIGLGFSMILGVIVFCFLYVSVSIGTVYFLIKLILYFYYAPIILWYAFCAIALVFICEKIGKDIREK
jgi:hypothetical protein